MSKDIGEEQESFVLGIVDGWCGNINTDAVDGSFLAWIRTES